MRICMLWMLIARNPLLGTIMKSLLVGTRQVRVVMMVIAIRYRTGFDTPREW